MILLRTITAGLTLRKVMPRRSKIPIPAPVVCDWIQSRKYRAKTAITTMPKMMAATITRRISGWVLLAWANRGIGRSFEENGGLGVAASECTPPVASDRAKPGVFEI